MNKSILKHYMYILIVIFNLFFYTIVHAKDQDVLSFTLVPPKEPVEIFGDMWLIYADGVIDINAAARLEQIIENNNISKHSIVYFNSPGGSLIGGVEIGRVIRKNQISTSVGKKKENKDNIQKEAICFSACTFAYLGGKFRYMSGNSFFGVHRFYSKINLPDAEDRAQIISAMIVSYLQEVGISEQFFVEMTRAGPNEIALLSVPEMERLGIINNGFEQTRWSFEVVPQLDTLYLKGERDTRYGFNKVMFFCEPASNEVVMYIMFDPQGREQTVLEMKAISLFIDGKAYPFDRYIIKPQIINNGWLDAVFKLNSDFKNMISNANTIGIAFQYSYEAPLFLGFNNMNFDGAREMYKVIINSCIK